VRWALAGGWLGATKEHSRQRSVTEEQRRQPPASAQPEGLPIFAAAAALLVGQRSLRIFSILAPCRSAKSLATHPLPIYEMGSNDDLTRFDRILLHLRCLCHDHKYRWHIGGVWRELRPSRRKQPISPATA